MNGSILVVFILAGGVAGFLLSRRTGASSGKLAFGLSLLPLAGIGLGMVFC